MKTKNKRSIYELRSYDGTITKEYRNYGSARKQAYNLIKNDIYCGIYELQCEKNLDGTDNINTLKWVQIIGC